MRVLIGDLEIAGAAQLADLLGSSGFYVDLDCDLPHSILEMRPAKYDLLLLSAMRPRLDGFQVLREIRKASKIPIVVLIGSQDCRDRALALRVGADDCLSAPYHEEELRARIEAVIRRTSPERVPSAFQAGDLRVFPESRQALFGPTPVKLTAMEYEILLMLVRDSGRVVSRDQICTRLYGRPTLPLDRSVDTHVSRIRRKLGEAGQFIISVRGAGYQLCPPQRPGS